MAFGAPRGGFGAVRASGFRNGPAFAAGGPSARGFGAGRGAGGWRGGAARPTMALAGGRHGGVALAGNGARFGAARTAGFSPGRTSVAANGFRNGGRSFGPAGVAALGGRGWTGQSASGWGATGWNAGYAGLGGWRGGWDGPGWNNWLWPVGLGLAIDWSLGYPGCPYWGYWGCWGAPYAAYWGANYWGPAYPWWGTGYAWGPAAYAWDAVYVSGPGVAAGVGYGWDDDWVPVSYAALPPTEYGVWSPDDARSASYYYADYSPGACVGRRLVWDDELGAYVRRPVEYPC